MGYDELEEANFNPYIRDKEENSYSYSDLSGYEPYSQGYNNYSGYFVTLMEDQSPFSLLVRDDSPISKRLKNPRAKGEMDRYTLLEESWYLFENLLGRSQYSGEFPQDESEDSSFMEMESDKELQEADIEEEEISFTTKTRQTWEGMNITMMTRAISQIFMQT